MKRDSVELIRREPVLSSALLRLRHRLNDWAVKRAQETDVKM
jgi:hypothetical protein